MFGFFRPDQLSVSRWLLKWATRLEPHERKFVTEVRDNLERSRSWELSPKQDKWRPMVGGAGAARARKNRCPTSRAAITSEHHQPSTAAGRPTARILQMVGLKDRPEAPKTGWKRVGEAEDLGEKIGTCEWDERAIQHVHTMHHLAWGYARVGSGCARAMMGDPWSYAPGSATQRDLDDWDDSETLLSANGTPTDRKRELTLDYLLRELDLSLDRLVLGCLLIILALLYRFRDRF